MQDTLSTLFEYMQWADGRVFDACAALSAMQYAEIVGGSFPSVQATVAHLTGAALVWQQRFEGDAEARFPDVAPFQQLDAARRQLGEAYTFFLKEAARPADVHAALLTYRNLAGQQIILPRWLALRHIVNHATYHRGQLTNMLRQLGATPPALDMTRWYFDVHMPKA